MTPGPTTGVLSLATNHRRFPEGLARLRKSVARSGFTGQFLGWPPGAFPDDCPAHADIPFAFKPFCFVEARRSGLDLALWLDAACIVVRSLKPLFQQIEAHGYVLFQNSNHRVGAWTSDAALARLGLSRDEAMTIPEVNASALGLDLRHPLAQAFLERWHEEARHGLAFRGVEESVRTDADYKAVKWNKAHRVSRDARVRGHRHDQSVAGILAHRLGMMLAPRGLQPYSRARPWISRATVVVVDRDLGRSDRPLTPLWRVRCDRYLSRVRKLIGRRRSP
jgi:hypothetical protein